MLIACDVTDNTAKRGAGLYNAYSMNLAGSYIARNVASEHGGGMYNDGKTLTTIYGAFLTGNTAYLGGGGIYNTGPLLIGGTTQITYNELRQVMERDILLFSPVTFEGTKG